MTRQIRPDRSGRTVNSARTGSTPLGPEGFGAEGAFFDLEFYRRRTARTIMYPVIPAELMGSALQLVIYFVAIVGAFFGFMLTTRA